MNGDAGGIPAGKVSGNMSKKVRGRTTSRLGFSDVSAAFLAGSDVEKLL